MNQEMREISLKATKDLNQMDDNYVKTGVMFKCHPIILGPSLMTGKKADERVLTMLDGYIEKHEKTLYDMLIKSQKIKTLVEGALPKEKRTYKRDLT